MKNILGILTAFMMIAAPLTSMAQTKTATQDMNYKRVQLIYSVEVIKRAQLSPKHQTTVKGTLELYAPVAAIVGANGLLISGGLALVDSVFIGSETTAFMIAARVSALLFVGGTIGTVVGFLLPEPTAQTDTVTSYLKTHRGLSALFAKDSASIIRTIDNVGDQELVDLIIEIAKKIEQN